MPDRAIPAIENLRVRCWRAAGRPAAVARVLREAGYQLEDRVRRPRPDKVRRSARARPNLADGFVHDNLEASAPTMHLVGVLDDSSRFAMGYGLHASPSSALIFEVLRSVIASYGSPAEIHLDNGPQCAAWWSKSRFSRELEQQALARSFRAPNIPEPGAR